MIASTGGNTHLENDCSILIVQRVFEENRNAEMVEMQRLEEQERRRREEKVSEEGGREMWETRKRDVYITCIHVIKAKQEE